MVAANDKADRDLTVRADIWEKQEPSVNEAQLRQLITDMEVTDLVDFTADDYFAAADKRRALGLMKSRKSKMNEQISANIEALKDSIDL